jgi:mannose-6-phosphate isomerase-like protein (cupin superfamily)
MHYFAPKAKASLRQVSDGKGVLNYIGKDISADFSLAVTQAAGVQESEVCAYDRAYFVMSGSLRLEVDGESLELGPEDSCFIGRGTEYAMSGTFRAVVVNSPAFGSLAD